MQSYQTYWERKICRATRLIWRGKREELPDLLGDNNLGFLFKWVW
jgi:hypothetical protein